MTTLFLKFATRVKLSSTKFMIGFHYLETIARNALGKEEDTPFNTGTGITEFPDEPQPKKNGGCCG